MAISIRHSQSSFRFTRSAPNRRRTPLTGTATRFALMICILAYGQFCLATTLDTAPSENHSPQQVVKIVINALKDNDAISNTGIATVFRFAAPANKLSTGPLLRFTTMIKRGFPEMLNHTSSRFDPMEVVGDTAIQAVWLVTTTGSEVGYAFQLSRQSEGEYAGMWMTDMVIPLGNGPGSGTSI